MSAEFESGVFANNEPAWHGLGITLPSKTLTLEEALQYSGLADWGLTKTPIYTTLPDGSVIEVPDKMANVRMRDGKYLGAVGTQHVNFSNEQAFALLEDIIGAGAEYETAISLYGGRKVAIVVHNPLADIELPDSPVRMYIMLATSHDGSLAITACQTPIRVVCANTLSAALASMHRAVKIRHTATAPLRAAEAQRVLGLSEIAAQRVKAQAEAMAVRPFSDSDFRAFLGTLIPVPAEEGRGRTMAREDQARISGEYNRESESAIRGTVWGAWQSVVAFSDHDKARRGTELERAENRFSSVMFPAAGSLPEKALALLA